MQTQRFNVFEGRSTLFAWMLPLLLLGSRVSADVTVVLTGLVFLYLSFKKRNWHWATVGWFRWFLVFWCYLLIVNTALSIDIGDTLKNALTFMRWPLFAIALSHYFQVDEQHKRAFIKSLLLVTIFVVLDSYWQYLFGLDWFGQEKLTETRLTGPFRKPVPGTFMLRIWFILVFAIYFFALFTNQNKRLFYSLTVLMLGLGFIFITGERMAFMLYLVGVIFCLLAMMLEFPSQKKRVAAGIALMLALPVVLAVLVPETAERTIWSIFNKIEHFADSDYGRVFYAAYQAWQESPVFGSGLHTYRAVCEQMGVLQQLGMACSHPHNLYLHLAAETGIIGVLLFSIVLVSLYIHVLRPLLASRLWLQAALCMSILTASFWPLTGGISVLSNWVAALIWLGVGWCLAISAASRQAPSVASVQTAP